MCGCICKPYYRCHHLGRCRDRVLKLVPETHRMHVVKRLDTHANLFRFGRWCAPATFAASLSRVAEFLRLLSRFKFLQSQQCGLRDANLRFGCSTNLALWTWLFCLHLLCKPCETRRLAVFGERSRDLRDPRVWAPSRIAL